MFTKLYYFLIMCCHVALSLPSKQLIRLTVFTLEQRRHLVAWSMIDIKWLVLEISRLTFTSFVIWLAVHGNEKSCLQLVYISCVNLAEIEVALSCHVLLPEGNELCHLGELTSQPDKIRKQN